MTDTVRPKRSTESRAITKVAEDVGGRLRAAPYMPGY
jgi:hypothetical protein